MTSLVKNLRVPVQITSSGGGFYDLTGAKSLADHDFGFEAVSEDYPAIDREFPVVAITGYRGSVSLSGLLFGFGDLAEALTEDIAEENRRELFFAPVYTDLDLMGPCGYAFFRETKPVNTRGVLAIDAAAAAVNREGFEVWRYGRAFHNWELQTRLIADPPGIAPIPDQRVVVYITDIGDMTALRFLFTTAGGDGFYVGFTGLTEAGLFQGRFESIGSSTPITQADIPGGTISVAATPSINTADYYVGWLGTI